MGKSWVVMSFVVLAGCGGSSADSDAVDAPGDVAGGEDGAPGDVGADDGAADVADAPVEGDGEADAGPRTDNVMLISSGVFGGGANTNLLVFNAVAADGERCRVQTIDGCTVVDCTPAPYEPVPPTVDLGTVELDRGTDTLLAVAPHGAYGVYAVTSIDGALWATGDALTFRTSGGEVGAFAHDLTAPPAVTLLAPTGAGTIVRAEPLVVSWEPVAGGVSITASQTPDTTTVLTSRRFLCEVDGSTGTFTVTPAVLAVLHPAIAYLNIGGNATADLDVDGYAVHLHLVQAATYQVSVE